MVAGAAGRPGALPGHLGGARDRVYQFVHTEIGNSIRAESGPVHVTVVDGVIAEVEPLTATGITPTPESYYTVRDHGGRSGRRLDPPPCQYSRAGSAPSRTRLAPSASARNSSSPG
jgi:hypothetical protein